MDARLELLCQLALEFVHKAWPTRSLLGELMQLTDEARSLRVNDTSHTRGWYAPLQPIDESIKRIDLSV